MKLKLTLLFLIATLMATAQSINKQVVSSGGETFSTANHKLTFTIGEPVIGTVENGAIVSQGFLAGAASGNTLTIDEQFLSNAIKVFPNPVVNHLNIDLNTIAGATKVLIYDITGQVVKALVLSSKNNTINLSYLQGGMYLVNLSFSDDTATKSFKIIKK